ncbi:MAG: autotransporter domain-containing protein [Chthoniobacteraceae bacterium]
MKWARFSRIILLLTILGIPASRTLADSATWSGANSNDWTDSSNWSAPVPNSSSDVATFTGTATSTTPTITGGPVNPTVIAVDSVVFTVGALNYNITVDGGPNGTNYAQITFNGAGVVNNSAATQLFTVGGEEFRGYMYFDNTSSAGSNTIYTINSGGVLELSGSSSGGSAFFTINNGGVMGIYGNSTADTASISNKSGGVLDLSGHTGGVTIGSVEGAGDIYLGGNNLTTGGDNSGATIDGVIHNGTYAGGDAGPASLIKTGAGTLVLTAANDYAGGTVIDGGVLQLGDGSTNDSAVGIGNVTVSSSGTFVLDLSSNAVFSNNITDNKLVILDDTPAQNYTVASIISGTGEVIKTGANTITLTGSNTYTGPTVVNQGTLQAGAAFVIPVGSALTVTSPGILDLNSFNQSVGSLAGNGSVTLGTATLTAGNDNSSTVFGGVISGPGGLTKVGSGALVITGTNTYMGTTTVNGGLLQVDGAIASGTTIVNAAGTLGGTGLIGGNVSNSGFVSPGDSPGKLTIGGNYVQTTAGTLVIQIACLSTGQYDLLSVGGTATLSGKLQVVRLNNFQPAPGNALTILTAAGGVSGQFTSVTTNTIIGVKVIYQPDDVVLDFFQNSFSGISGLTPNQFAVAHNLDFAANDPRNAGLNAFLANELLGNLPHDFDLISPEQLTSIFGISFSFADVQGSNIETRLAEIRAENTPSANVGVSVHSADGSVGLRKDDDDKKAVSAPAAEAPHWNLFMEGNGEFVHVNGDPNAAGYNFTTGGVTVGADYRVCDHFTIGIMGGYADTGATLTQGGAVDVNSGRVGIYSTAYGNGFYLNTLAAGGYNSYDTHRTGLGGIAQGNTDGEEFDGLISTGYDFHSGNFTVGPIASAQYTYVGINSFNENGSLAPLNIPSQNQESFRSKVGFKVSSLWHVGGIVVTPVASAAWQHEYLDSTYALDSSFASGAGNVFTVAGPTLGRDSVVVNAGVNVQWTPRLGTYLYYDGELGRKNYELNSVSGGVKVNF